MLFVYRIDKEEQEKKMNKNNNGNDMNGKFKNEHLFGSCTQKTVNAVAHRIDKLNWIVQWNSNINWYFHRMVNFFLSISEIGNANNRANAG